MTAITASVAAPFDDGDLGDWIGIDIESAADHSRPAALSYEPWAYWRAVTANNNYFAAIEQKETGKAAWWIYSADDIIATALTDEDDYAVRLGKMRGEAKLEALRRLWRSLSSATAIYPEPIRATDLYKAVVAATAASPSKFSPVVGAPSIFSISNEVVTINNTARIATRYRPSGDAEVLFASRIVSAKTRQPLQLLQTSPGIFELSEPGYGALIVSYATTRRLVYIEYEAFSGGQEGFWSSAVKEQFARDTLLSGSYPEKNAPPVMLLITSRRSHSQTVANSPRRASSMGAQMAASAQFALAANKDADEQGITLSENSRSVASRRIVSSTSPNQYVDVEIATEIVMQDSTGKTWTFKYSAG